MSHLDHTGPTGVRDMASSLTAAVLLPTTARLLQLRPPVRQMLDQRVLVALGTDFNPNAYCLSMVLASLLPITLFGYNICRKFWNFLMFSICNL